LAKTPGFYYRNLNILQGENKIASDSKRPGANPLIAQLYAIMIRTIRTIDSWISFLLRPAYYWLAQTGILRRLVPIQKKVRVPSFNRSSGKDRWRIRRPYHLFVDEASLSKGNSNHLTSLEPKMLQSNEKASKNDGEIYGLTEQIRNIHKELTLCGEPRNALLGLSDDFLTYISSILKDESPKPPKASLNQWSEVLSILHTHWIIPLLYRLVSTRPQEFRPPDEVFRRMRKSFLASRVRCLYMERQLGEISEAFQNEGIRTLVLKGPATAWSAYPDPAMRPSSDLDLLVLPEQIAQTRTLLERLDYKCLGKRYEHSKDFFCEETFIPQRNSRDNRAIELHWDLHSFSGIKRDGKVEDLFHRAVKIELLSVTFETLHPVDALIHRALNMTLWHNKAIRLIWIYDIALLARCLKVPDDWKVLQERSVAWRARLALEKSIKIAQVWVGLQLPDVFKDFSSWPRPTESEVAAWSDVIHRYDRINSYIKLHWSNSSGIFKKVRFLFHLLFPDPKTIRMDYPPKRKWLLPLSYVRRLYRWFVQFFVKRIIPSKQRG